MPVVSAGIVLHRRRAGRLEVFLVHPGGPFFARKDAGAWSIPKGLVDEGEEPLAAALREFAEETGCPAPPPPYAPLGEIRQKGGKRVIAFAAAGDCDPAQLKSNAFRVESPRGSGNWRSYPEVDRAAWFPLEEAREKILVAQAELLERLEAAANPADEGS